MAGEIEGAKVGLTFRLDSGGCKLSVSFVPTDEKPPINLTWIKQALAAAGFADLYLYEHALVELLKRYNAATQPFTFDLGERRNGSFTITCTPDNLEARLTIIPAYGGKTVAAEQVRQALKEKGVVFGVDEETINRAVADGAASDLLVARGIPPQSGTDGELVSFVPEIRDRQPQLLDNDRVDYRNLGQILSVRAGDPLMRRIPPVEGVAGTSITGKAISPPPVRDAAFAPNLSGTAFDADDPNLLVAAVAGQPILVANGIVVEQVLRLKLVDLSVGNLDFNGTIDIAGDVVAGMTVKASGDIIIGGVVEASRIEAGGNIEVRGGVIGQGDSRPSTAEAGRDAVRIKAGGCVAAQFVENAFVEAGDSIQVQEFCMQSELVAGNQIVVGHDGGSKGHVIGGSCQAVNLVRAVTLGSHAGVHTAVSVGVDPHVRERFSTVRLKLQEKEREMDELTKKLEYYASLPSAPPEQVALTREARDKLQSVISELTGEKKRLQKRLEQVASAQVVVEREVLIGVAISIGAKVFQVDEDLGPTVFRIEEGAIVASS
ncbi:FapA family protein [Geobacter sulfurreducens]|uniref:FapA family protein n=1 Tax=Geobacter sulfurreducens TaxID=35554 RepID=UPI002572B5C4|nr:FapA family protein [Geobacter sulfurreducens]BEH09045.1 FapA family protein [Geobacter sulfurreducens subsp. ethanolicus]HML77774.1 FapA family protein [Geobacter sulfurreducens]